MPDWSIKKGDRLIDEATLCVYIEDKKRPRTVIFLASIERRGKKLWGEKRGHRSATEYQNIIDVIFRFSLGQ